MSKQSDTASALAGILKARRGEDSPANATPAVVAPSVPEVAPLPSPAPLLVATSPNAKTVERKGRSGKSSDPSYSQFSVWLRKDIRKKAGRALDDADTGQDFSELVQELLDKWLASRT
jgi:hypothetical protein